MPSADLDDYIKDLEAALHVNGLTQGFSDLRNTW
jgi:hypothetical protein